MRRTPFVVFAVVLSLSVGHATIAAAEGPLRAAAKAEAVRLAKVQGASRDRTAVRVDQPVVRSLAAAQNPQAPTSGSRKGLKVAFAIGAAVAFAATAFAIDRSVENNTPSSLGLRQD